ncbi:MAG: LarC family nickel insertion protein, partial [Eubacterium sp.]|nr:LarC family nickel insertion protein [Eubacterium sp.]
TDIPSYSSDRIKGELCTPTGAALVKYFAFEFGAQPVMAVNKIGYGMGKKDFDQANCVRAILGTAHEDADMVVELSCNVDDMTSEEIGFATEMLMDAGALDVYTISIGMKKNRPGFLLTCMCREDRKEALIKEIFKHTTTIGIRENTSSRYILSREVTKSETPYGEVRIKRSTGFDVTRSKLEYEDLAGIARRTGKSLLALKKELEELINNTENS